MKAAVINNYGKPEVLEVKEIPDPEPGPDEILIEIDSASINPVDIKIRSGKFKKLTGSNFPMILGADFSGRVLSSPHADILEGEEVFGMVDPLCGGCYAEKILIKRNNISPRPVHLDMTQSGVSPLVGLTVIQSLIKVAHLKAGDHIFINGCTGGVGSLAVSFSKKFGAQIDGACSAENKDFAHKQGVTNVFDYNKEEAFTHAIRDKKYDIIFDTVGNLKYEKIRKYLNRPGNFITTGYSFKIFAFSMISKRCNKIFVKPNEIDLRLLKQLMEKNNIIPHIHSSFPLEDIQKAHYQYDKGVQGKIGITFLKT